MYFSIFLKSVGTFKHHTKQADNGNKRAIEQQNFMLCFFLEEKRADMLTPKTQSPIKTDSLYGRIRNWFINED